MRHWRCATNCAALCSTVPPTRMTCFTSGGSTGKLGVLPSIPWAADTAAALPGDVVQLCHGEIRNAGQPLQQNQLPVRDLAAASRSRRVSCATAQASAADQSPIASEHSHVFRDSLRRRVRVPRSADRECAQQRPPAQPREECPT